MLLLHDMAHIATRFSVFCSMIWPILLYDWAQISKEMQATSEKGVYLFAEKYILFAQKVHTFLPKNICLLFRGYIVFQKGTMVWWKKYYRFA